MSLSSANPTHLRPDPGDPTCNQLVDREMACLPQASLTEALLDRKACLLLAGRLQSFTQTYLQENCFNFLPNVKN